MKTTRDTSKSAFRGGIALIALAIACQAAAQSGYQVTEDPASPTQGSYHIGEDSNPTISNSGPVRMARFSMIQGSVTWRPSRDESWSTATTNLPIRQGSEIWVNTGSRAEIQFDDGSYLRLGAGAIATLQTLYSDDKGEFTEIKLNSGLASLRLKTKLSMYQVDTPIAAVKAYGPAKIRVGAAQGMEVAVQQGEAQVEGANDKVTLYNSDYLDLANESSQYNIERIPGRDSWDKYNDDRDYALAHPSSYLPSNIALVAGDLDSYGTWRSDPTYGHVWCPRVIESDWRPYHHGRWVWVQPFGWTWCSDEAWGWAPYHYGTWVHQSYGWAWCPGPVQQCWSPAVVQFSNYDGRVGWCPLSPHEVRYSSFAVGFRSGNWALSFSIGSTGCYYPSYGGYCTPRRWDNRVVNRVTDITHINNVYNTTINKTVVVNNNFISRNARYGVQTSAQNFGTGTSFQRMGSADVAAFHKGRSYAAPTGSASPIAGPAHVAPTQASFSPTHTLLNKRAPESVIQRSVFRPTLPPAVSRASSPMPHAVNPPTHTTRAPSSDRYDRFNPNNRTNGDRSNGNPPRTERTDRSRGNTTGPDRTDRPRGTSDRPVRSGNDGQPRGGYRQHENTPPSPSRNSPPSRSNSDSGRSKGGDNNSRGGDGGLNKGRRGGGR